MIAHGLSYIIDMIIRIYDIFHNKIGTLMNFYIIETYNFQMLRFVVSFTLIQSRVPWIISRKPWDLDMYKYHCHPR